jgi:hypothetical protein
MKGAFPFAPAARQRRPTGQGQCPDAPVPLGVGESYLNKVVDFSIFKGLKIKKSRRISPAALCLNRKSKIVN